MSVVIDNSMALAWVLPDEKNVRADAVLDRVTREGGYVPFIFRAEFGNGLTVALRSGRIDGVGRTVALDRMHNALNLVVDLAGVDRTREAVDLADYCGLTVYDALYLELALRMRVPIATFDKKLASAARKTAVDLALPEI